MFVPLQELDNFILLLYNNVLVTWSWSQKKRAKDVSWDTFESWCSFQTSCLTQLCVWDTIYLHTNLLVLLFLKIIMMLGDWHLQTSMKRQGRPCPRITSQYQHEWHRKTRRHHDRQNEEQRLIKQLSLLKIIYVSKECFNHCLMFKQK